MRKIFAFLCALSFAVQFNLLSAQTTVMKVWKDGSATLIPTADVDSVTFVSTPIHLINGHKFVDLGLPSGLLWAETNIGAKTAADEGGYFAWGETTTKSNYSWNTYKYGSSASNLTKYNSTDGKTVLENADDAAYVNWGDSCRMPTKAEFEEILDSTNCTWTWSCQINSSGNSVNGYKVVSKKNGNSIFFPALGYRSGDDFKYHGSHGSSWLSTLSMSDVFDAYFLYFYANYHSTYCNYRYAGHTIRPVARP